MLIDTHAHLTYPGLTERIDEVLRNARREGVHRVITIGTRVTDARAALSLSRARADIVSCAAGFHPHEADKVSPEDFAAMQALWNEPDWVAFGEMGLDYHYDFANRDNQKRVLHWQLERCAPVDKPVIVHCREALDDVIPILLKHGYEGRRVVFHCFTGTRAEVERIARHGWRISFTGIVTFANSKELQAIAKDYPAERLMVETDAPYLSPVPVRNVRPCEPAFVAHTARFLAELRGISFENFVNTTTANAKAFFGL